MRKRLCACGGGVVVLLVVGWVGPHSCERRKQPYPYGHNDRTTASTYSHHVQPRLTRVVARGCGCFTKAIVRRNARMLVRWRGMGGYGWMRIRHHDPLTTPRYFSRDHRMTPSQTLADCYRLPRPLAVKPMTPDERARAKEALRRIDRDIQRFRVGLSVLGPRNPS